MTIFKKTGCFLLVTILLASPALAQDKPSSSFDATKLQKYLTVKAALLGITDNMSLYFEDLNHSEEIAFDPTRAWIPASIIKAFVLPEVFRQRQIGQINFDQKVTIVADNVVPTQMESDEFPTLTEGTVVTVRQLVEIMVIQSDNTAYNTLLDILDRRNINATLRHLGITETVVGQKLNLDDAQSQKDLAVPGQQLNTTTVKDFSTLFGLLYDKEIADSNEILAIFKRQKINDMIPALLPKDTTVAHKTGTWNPIFHDGGIVFKPDAPFLLTIFTNSNDPTAVAQLAKVAYSQTADSVTSTETPSQTFAPPPSPHKVYLASDEENRVLAASTTNILNATYVTQPGDTLESIAQKFYDDSSRASEILTRNSKLDPNNIGPGTTIIIPNVPGTPSENQKFPQITAADLGITKADLTIGKDDAGKIPYAFITPDSILYPLKTWWQNRQFLQAKTDQDRVAVLLDLSRSRLSEIKTLSKIGNLQPISSLLDRSQFYLIEAADLSQKLPNKNELLFKISQQNDTHTALLAGTQPRTPQSQDQLIDTVYNFSQKQKDQLAPRIASIKANNILQQTPLIGEIAAASENSVTLKFADGQTQTVSLNNLTPVRQFQNKNLENASVLKTGSKIALIGQTGTDGKITPRFILNNLPAELPARRRGIVTKVDPGNNTIEIQEASGKKDKVTTSDDTTIKAKDTKVGLAGIRTGSQVTVFGQGSAPASAPAPAPSPATIHATSITVTHNGSGKHEKEEKSQPKKVEPKKPEEVKK